MQKIILTSIIIIQYVSVEIPQYTTGRTWMLLS